VATLIATAGCSLTGSSPPATYTFRAVIAMVDLGDDPALWASCADDPVLHDGNDVVLANSSELGTDPVAVTRLANGSRVPLRETFADNPAYSIQPPEAMACTWSISMPDVPTGGHEYELRVGRFKALLSEAQVRDGVRLAVAVTSGDSVDIFGWSKG
jgi:hypothetical protein